VHTDGIFPIERSIVISETRFDQCELVGVLVNAICCSLEGFYHRTMTIINLVEGSLIKVDDAIMLTTSTYEWLGLSKVYNGLLTKDMYCHESETKKLYLISYLGMGATSKVYRALSESGHGCVVKLYVQCRDEGNHLMPDEEFTEFSTDLVTKEESNYKLLHQDLCQKQYVWHDQLNELQCLIMPFFTPIPKEERTSDEVVNGIREQLQHFGQKGKMFRQCDQLWRHVGRFQDKIYLFDLGDLVDVVDDDTLSTSSGDNDDEPDFIRQMDLSNYIDSHIVRLIASA
jgi:hypothetical protein